MTLILSDSNLLGNCENIFKEPSEKSIPKKVVTRSKQKRHSSVNLRKRCMKNNKPTHCQEEIIKQGKVVCGLESTEELLEEEVVCQVPRPWSTNKWSHDQNENEAGIHRAGSQEAASHDQGNSYSLADDMLNHSFEMMHTSSEFFSQSVSCERSLSLHARFIFFSKTLQRQQQQQHKLYYQIQVNLIYNIIY